MRLSTPRIVSAFVLVSAVASPVAARAARPDADDQDAKEIHIPDARILSLSPDGQLLAVRTPSDGRPEQLCIYEVSTQTERTCGDLEARQLSMADDNVAWSPDSTQIAFTEDALRLLIDSDLWVVDASSGNLMDLTDDAYEGRLPVTTDEVEQPDTPIHVDVLPAWAADGRSIAFSRSSIIDGELGGNEIVSVDVESGQVESLTRVTPAGLNVVYWGLALAPDGQRLFYSVAHPDRADPDNGVWEYDPATGRTRQIVPSDPQKGPPALLRVSATGMAGFVVYPFHMLRVGPTGEFHALVDLETDALLPLHLGKPDLDPPAVVTVATFSPDGTRVLYGLGDGDAGRLYVRDVPDGQPQEVVSVTDARPLMTTLGGGLSWASDGTVFVATSAGEGLILHLEPELR